METSANVGGVGLAAISVRRATGLVTHYVSLPFAWRRRDARALSRGLRELAAHLLATSPGEVWVETPGHPLPSRRERKRYA